MNLKLAESMGWVIPLTSSTYDIGPNLLLELPFGITSTKPDPADCQNTLFTFTKPIHVKDWLLYLCSAFRWRFINLDAAFANGTTHVYKPPLIARNAFEDLMNDVAKWSFDQGLTNGHFTELAISPHFWNRKVLRIDLVKDDSKKAYSVQFSWSIYSLPKGNNYTLCVELYQTDQWLFEHAEVTFTNSSYGVTVGNMKITKHTHKCNGQHILYYHKIEAQIQRWATSPPTYVFVNYDVNHVTDWYSKRLRNFMPFILYGEDWVEEVEDVYDGHHVMEKPTTTTETKTVPKATKKSTTTAVHHGDTQPSPLNLYSNLTKSIFGTTDILKVSEYQHKTKMLEFNPIQFHPLRHSSRQFGIWPKAMASRQDSSEWPLSHHCHLIV